MNRKPLKNKEQSGERRLPALGGAFLLGALVGSLCCVHMKGLRNVLEAQGQAPVTWWQALWPNLVLLAVLLLSGYLRAGCLTALITMAVKGFALSAQSTVQVLALGNSGYAAALITGLIPGFLTVAALILLGRQAMGWSVMGLRSPPGRGRRPRPDSTYFLTAAICTGLLLSAALVESRVVPGLWSAVQKLLEQM